jgi:hypothetical protein
VGSSTARACQFINRPFGPMLRMEASVLTIRSLSRPACTQVTAVGC